MKELSRRFVGKNIRLVLLLAATLFTLPAIAQQKYNYTYATTIDFPSSDLSMALRDSTLNGKSLVLIHATDQSGLAAIHTNFAFKCGEKTTTIEVDSTGYGAALIDTGNYRITIYSIEYKNFNPLNVALASDEILDVVLQTIYNNPLTNAEIHSKRELTPEEIESITKAYNKGRSKEHELIRNNTCYVKW